MLLFTILKVIGLVLLFLLLLILLLLGLVLLVPFRYAGAGHKGEEAEDYAAHIDLCWLLRMVQLHAGITPAGLEYSLRILCFRPLDSRKPDMPAANASDETSSRSEEEATDDEVADVSDENPSVNEAVTATDDTVADAADGVGLQEESVNVSESAAQTAAVDSVELKSVSEPDERTEAETAVTETLTSEEVSESEDASDHMEDNRSGDVSDGVEETKEAEETKETESSSIDEKPQVSTPKKKKRKKSSFADRIKRVCEKASSLREMVEDEENQKAVRLLISRVKYLLHHLRFRKFEGRLVFGFEDPATMGRILAVLSLFYPLYGESFTITPVFDHALFEGEIALKGHVRLIHVLIAGIQLMMNKKIRGLVLDRI